MNSSLLLSNSFIISHLFEFVKYFFKISFDFFRLVLFSFFLRCNFYIISYSFAFVKYFFKISFDFFLDLLLSYMISCLFAYSLLRFLHSLSCSGSLEYLSVHLTFASLVLPFRESALLLYAFRPVLSTLF